MESVRNPQSVDEYISCFPSEIQKRLSDIRSVIKKEAPEAAEKITYRMPAYTFRGMMMLYFAAHSKHTGLYPFPSAVTTFREELSSYKNARGSIQFPHDKPLPLKLISEIVKFRVQEILMKEELKAEKKKRRKKIR